MDMKIALIRREYTDFGGAERYLAALANALCDVGHEVHILAGRWKSGDTRLRFHQVRTAPGPGFVKILSFARNCLHLTSQGRYDIIHSFERTLKQDVYRAGDGCHKEWLIQRRQADSLPKRWSYRLNPLHLTYLYLEKRLFADPRLQRVIANSHRGKREIVSHYGVSPERICVIHNGVDRTLLKRSAASPPADVPWKSFILFVGSGFERKGLTTAIRAVAMLDDPAARLVVVGKDRPAPYAALASKLGAGERVFFAGPRREVGSFYRAASAFVLPTLYEPFSNACLEASAFGLPVVTTRANGFSECLKEGETGYVLEDPLDAESAAAALRKALRGGRVVPPNYPTIEDNVKEMLKVYEDIRWRG